MGRFRRTVIGVHLQVFFLGYWPFEVDEPKKSVVLHEKFPSLSAVMLDTYLRGDSREIGYFIFVIRSCTSILSVFLLQTPTQAQIVEYCEDLRGWVLANCPWVAVHNLHLTELAAFLQFEMENRFSEEPDVRSQLPTLLPFDTDDSVHRARIFNAPVTWSVFSLMMKNFTIMFRDNGMKFRSFVQISRRYKHHEIHIDQYPPWPGLEQLHSSVTDTDDHLHPVGDRVKLEKFCEPAQDIPEKTTCSVCMEDVVENGSAETKDKDKVKHEDESADETVVTKCGHFFHRVCLDTWVNDSGMKTSNSCPSCREELSQGRERKHVSQIEGENQIGDDDASSDYSPWV
jgi:hypothetical protein